VSNEDIQKALGWLKINQAPWEIVLEKWRLTSKYRLQVLTKSSDKRLTNILEEWPLLKHPYRYKLITYDFDQMQLTNFCLTSEKWNEFFSTIKQNVQGPSKNDDFSNLIETLDLDISEGKVINFLYLCYTIHMLNYNLVIFVCYRFQISNYYTTSFIHDTSETKGQTKTHCNKKNL